jgi:tRNA1Val (adenine37-N6)-methyltransferase
MAKEYFRFKQFTVWQDKAAMKVCTDSCLFGAWIPLSLQTTKVLDIGAGTGLLALMLAQRRHSGMQLDAVELDTAAATQARANFSESPWANQLQLHEGAIQNFTSPASQLYDLVVCNPPFYAQSLQRAGSAANMAMHSTGLSQQELLAAVLRLLCPEGELAVLLPPFEMEQFKLLCNNAGLYATNWQEVFDREGGKCIRIMAIFSRAGNRIITSRLAIKNELGQYTEDFATLLREYYLIF